MAEVNASDEEIELLGYGATIVFEGVDHVARELDDDILRGFGKRGGTAVTVTLGAIDVADELGDENYRQALIEASGIAGTLGGAATLGTLFAKAGSTYGPLGAFVGGLSGALLGGGLGESGI
ncbi:hypothetical protein [Jannaschia aquimarina]|uniref:hypothetical protein n=1 Tax=Jannaschia aquimarina TaxID=935700 RepID=UPI0011313D6E|nr:hypothetical protein [Jannaschia aquimarina]